MVTLVRTPRSVEKQTTAQPENPEPLHLTSEDIAAFLSDNISYIERERILRHLADCDHCRKTVAEIVLSQTAIRDPDEPKT